jgi:hypothetical protein
MKKESLITVKEWEKFEAEKSELLLKTRAETEVLNNKRPGLLLRMAEDDKTAFSELQKIDVDIARLKTEAEAIETLLKAIPARKDYARGVEIEAVIPTIEKMEAEIPALVDDVHQKAEALILANDKLYGYLGNFDSIDETQSLALKSEFINAGINELQSYGSLGSPGGRTSADLEMVLLQMTYDKEKLSAWAENARLSVAKRLDKIRDHIQRLKGKELPSFKIVYCPHCYEDVGYPSSGEKYTCRKCNKTFEYRYVMEESNVELEVV